MKRLVFSFGLAWAVTAFVTAQTPVQGTLRPTQQGSTLLYSFQTRYLPDSTKYTWGIKRASDPDAQAYLLGGTCTKVPGFVVMRAADNVNTLPWGDYYLIIEATLPDRQRFEFKWLLPISRNQLPNPN